MSEVKLENILKFHNLDPNRSYLVLIAVDKTPPHLALISEQMYYSVSSRGVKQGIDANMILASLIRKKVPVLLLELNILFSNEALQKEFSKFSNLKHGQSCLLPIIEIFCNIDAEYGKAKFVFELIPKLMKNKMIRKIHCLGMESDSFTLKKYGQREIDMAIKNAAQLC